MMIKVILPIDFAYNDKKISPGYISRPQGWWCVFKRLFLMTIIRFGGNFYFDSVSIWYGAKPKGHQTKVFIHIQKDGSRLFIHFWTITWTIGHQGFEQPYPRFQQCLMFFISWNDLCLMVADSEHGAIWMMYHSCHLYSWSALYHLRQGLHGEFMWFSQGWFSNHRPSYIQLPGAMGRCNCSDLHGGTSVFRREWKTGAAT